MLVWEDFFVGNNLLDISWGINNWMWVNTGNKERFEGISSSKIRSSLEVEL
jgi:hypothetical protein